jgi:tellurite resistance protein TerC
MNSVFIQWFLFFSFVVILLLYDLGFLSKKKGDKHSEITSLEEESISFKRNVFLSLIYIGMSLLFSFYIFYIKGTLAFEQFLTGYVLEKSLSLDNVFVIALIFKYFNIPQIYQKRVLLWGILGAIFLRAIFIGFGSVLIHQFTWVLHVFGGILIFSGIKMLVKQENEADFSNSFLIKTVEKFIAISKSLEGDSFFIKAQRPLSTVIIKNYVATPLFLSLVLIEFVDLIFAFDSVPAIFSITTDLYVVYTSNIFAILGLRSLYFVLQKMIERFEYLHYSLSALLIFIGSKIFIKDIIGPDILHTKLVLLITLLILLAGIIPSYMKKK